MYSGIPFWYLGGLLILGAGLGLPALLWKEKRAKLLRALGLAVIVFSPLFWGFVFVTTNIQRDFTFDAQWRHTPGASGASQALVTLEYADHPGCYEQVNSAEIYEHLRNSDARTVSVTVRVNYDFGRARAYGLEKVGDLEANAAWVTGKPPWEVFRRIRWASRWIKFVER